MAPARDDAKEYADSATESESEQAPLPKKRKLDVDVTAAVLNSSGAAEDEETVDEGHPSWKDDEWPSFPEPTVARTWNRFDATNAYGIKLEKVIGPDDIESVLMAGYGVSPEWLAQEVFEPTVRVMVICPTAKIKIRGSHTPLREERPNFECWYPRNLPQVWTSKGEIDATMHCKFFLIFRKTSTRLVITSANQDPYDWDSVLNALVITDFPRAEDDGKDLTDHLPPTDCERVLVDMLGKLSVPIDRYTRQLALTNFGDIDEKMRLVSSWSGKRFDAAKMEYGQLHLARQVRALGCQVPDGYKLRVEFNSSTCNKYQAGWPKDFYNALSGLEPTGPARLQFATDADVPFYYLYPSVQNVQETHLDERGGPTFYGPWRFEGFTKSNIRQSISSPPGVLQHSKMALVLFETINGTVPPLDYDANRGYVYIGSHNAGPPAWGTLFDGKKKLEIRNIELGVILPLRARSDDELKRRVENMVTWQRPIKKYGAADTPWDFEKWAAKPQNKLIERTESKFDFYHDQPDGRIHKITWPGTK